MSKKWIKVPEDVRHVDDFTGEPIKLEDRDTSSFTDIVRTACRDEAAWTGFEALEDRQEFVEVLRKHRPEGPDGPVRPVKPGDKICVSARAYDRLVKSLKEPKYPWNPIALAALAPLLNAILRAKDSPEDLD